MKQSKIFDRLLSVRKHVRIYKRSNKYN